MIGSFHHATPGDVADAIEAASTAAPAWRDLPFIFVTSTARDSVSRAHGLALGAQDYLVRPLDAAELLTAIGRALRRPAGPALPV